MDFLNSISSDIFVIIIMLLCVAVILGVYQRRKKQSKQTLNFAEKAQEAASVQNSAADKTTKKSNAQGSKNDYLQAMSSLINLARKKKWFVIAPSVIEFGGEQVALIALFFTPNKIIAVRAFGFGGTIFAASGEKDWKQLVGETEQKILSPIKAQRTTRECLYGAMNDCGIEHTALDVLCLYTHPHVDLRASQSTDCYKTKNLLDYLSNLPSFDKAKNETAKAQAEKLKAYMPKGETPTKEKA